MNSYMGKINIIISVLFCQLLFGCSDSIKDRLTIPGSENQIKKVVIYDKTNRKVNLNKIEMVDKDKIRKICDEIRGLEEVSNISTKAHFGYYQVELTTVKDETFSLDVVYTIYNGVVIEMNNKTYKNDDLESLILHYFQ
jgi:hypothetical protein